ncbi:MAG: sulfite exporter TauE/SafE family protein [Pseudomonadota bacterium]
MDADLSLAFALIALLIAGAGAGFAAGLFGIGGGFVVVPALVFLLPIMGTGADLAAHVAVGTSLATIIFTSIRSTQSHAARGAVDFDVLKSWAPWVVAGTVLGSLIANVITGDELTLIFGVGVLGFAAHFLLNRRDAKPAFSNMPQGASRIGIAGFLGGSSALLGIGGGTLTTLVMTMCGNAIHRAIGTAAGMGAIIAIPSTFGFVLIGWGQPDLPFGSLGYVNIPAALAIIITSVIFAPLGVATAHRLPAHVLRMVFGLYLGVVGLVMVSRYWA